MSITVAVALAGCAGAKPRTPIAAFNDCVSNSSAGLGTSDPPTRSGFELIFRRSDSLAIGTVFLLDSPSQAKEFARLSKGSPDQFVVAHRRYMVGVYSMLPKRYVNAIAGCLSKLPA